MEDLIESIRGMNVDFLCFRVEALEAGFLPVLVVEVEQYRVESLGFDSSGESGDNSGLTDSAFAALGE